MAKPDKRVPFSGSGFLGDLYYAEMSPDGNRLRNTLEGDPHLIEAWNQFQRELWLKAEKELEENNARA